jgi:hypothetical protein
MAARSDGTALQWNIRLFLFFPTSGAAATNEEASGAPWAVRDPVQGASVLLCVEVHSAGGGRGAGSGHPRARKTAASPGRAVDPVNAADGLWQLYAAICKSVPAAVSRDPLSAIS